MKKTACAIFTFFLVLISFLPLKTVQGAQQDPVYQKIKQSGELVVGLSADYAPYEFHADVNGQDKVVGFDISIAQKIAKDMGVKLKIEELGFDALLGALKTGKIDLVISGMAMTDERLKEVDFSDTYLVVDQKVLVRKADQKKYRTTADFSGVPVGVQKQTTQEALAQNEMTGSKVTSLQKVPDIVTNLLNQKVDAAVLEGPVADAYVEQNKAVAISPVKFEQGKKDTAIAMAKNTPELKKRVNASIKEVTKQGLMKKYQKAANQLMFQKDQTFFQKYGKFYLSGAKYTLILAFVGVLFGMILGTLLALMKLGRNKLLKALAIAYIEYVRGTPLLVQVFIVYFGTGVLGLELSKLTAGCIAVALNSAAYVAEIVRAGIKAVNVGQTEAARSLGMNQNEALRFVIFPQAIKNILPALGNEFVSVIKESSVVSVIGVSELIFQTGVVQGASFKPFLPYVIVSLVYFAMTFVISRALGFAERRLANG